MLNVFVDFYYDCCSEKEEGRIAEEGDWEGEKKLSNRVREDRQEGGMDGRKNLL